MTLNKRNFENSKVTHQEFGGALKTEKEMENIMNDNYQIGSQYATIQLPIGALKEEILSELKEYLDKRYGGMGDDSLKLYTPKEVKAILHISTKQFQKMRQDKVIPFSQTGRKIYVKKSDLEDYIQKNRIGPIS